MSVPFKKLPWQIYSKLPKIPYKSFNSQKNMIKFHTHHFEDLKDLNPILG